MAAMRPQCLRKAKARGRGKSRAVGATYNWTHGVMDRFSPDARRVLDSAGIRARLLEHSWIGAEHLLLGLLSEDCGIARGVLSRAGVVESAVEMQVVRAVGRGALATPNEALLNGEAKEVLTTALYAAKVLGQDHIEPEHLLVAVTTRVDGTASRILMNLGVSPVNIRAEAIQVVIARDLRPFAVDRLFVGKSGSVTFTESVGRLINAAERLAGRAGRARVCVPDVLLAAVEDPTGRACLSECGVSAQAFKEAVQNVYRDED